MDAVSSDQCIDRCPRSVLELRLDLVATLAESGQTVTEMHPFGWQRFNQHVEHVGAVRLILPEAEMAFNFHAERRAQQSPPVVPALLMHGHGLHTEAGELVAQAQPMNHASCVRRHVDASADFA